MELLLICWAWSLWLGIECEVSEIILDLSTGRKLFEWYFFFPELLFLACEGSDSAFRVLHNFLASSEPLRTFSDFYKFSERHRIGGSSE